MIRPFDIVKVTGEANLFHDDILPRKITAYGLVTTTTGRSASVRWFDRKCPLKNAWWDECDVSVIGNVFEIIANEMDCYSHSGGDERMLQGSMFMSEDGLKAIEERQHHLEEENREMWEELVEARKTIKAQKEYIQTLSK